MGRRLIENFLTASTSEQSLSQSSLIMGRDQATEPHSGAQLMAVFVSRFSHRRRSARRFHKHHRIEEKIRINLIIESFGRDFFNLFLFRISTSFKATPSTTIASIAIDFSFM
jgi:hypothetical protein